MSRLVAAILAAGLIATGGCSLIPDLRTGTPPPSPAPSSATLSVVGAGTFACGQSFHGCSAWFVVRPAGWEAPDPWAPGIADAEIGTRGDMRGGWLVAGPAIGGPGTLARGEHTFALVFTEVSDIEPFVPGTDDRPGTGVIDTTIACQREVTLGPEVRHVAVQAVFGPVCGIEVRLDPAP